MPQSKDISDRPIFLQSSNTDVLRLRDVVEGGTFIFGQVGAGKTLANPALSTEPESVSAKGRSNDAI